MIILLGAGGFIGYSIGKYLQSNSISHVTVSRSFQWPQNSYETRSVASISSTEKYIDLISSGDTIIYMGGSTDLASAESDSVNDLVQHLAEMEALILRLKFSFIKLSQIAFLSSAGTVYGDSNGLSLDEQSSISPKSTYGRRNYILESLIHASYQQIAESFLIFRVSNPFGPFQFRFRRKGLIQSLLTSSIQGNEVVLRGSGLQVRDYIFSPHMSSCICNIIHHKNAQGVFNIASGFSFSGLELVELLNSLGVYPACSCVSSAFDYEVNDSLLLNSRMRDYLSLDTNFLFPLSKQNIMTMLASMPIE